MVGQQQNQLEEVAFKYVQYKEYLLCIDRLILFVLPDIFDFSMQNA